MTTAVPSNLGMTTLTTSLFSEQPLTSFQSSALPGEQGAQTPVYSHLDLASGWKVERPTPRSTVVIAPVSTPLERAHLSNSTSDPSLLEQLCGSDAQTTPIRMSWTCHETTRYVHDDLRLAPSKVTSLQL